MVQPKRIDVPNTQPTDPVVSVGPQRCTMIDKRLPWMVFLFLYRPPLSSARPALSSQTTNTLLTGGSQNKEKTRRDENGDGKPKVQDTCPGTSKRKRGVEDEGTIEPVQAPKRRQISSCKDEKLNRSHPASTQPTIKRKRDEDDDVQIIEVRPIKRARARHLPVDKPSPIEKRSAEDRSQIAVAADPPKPTEHVDPFKAYRQRRAAEREAQRLAEEAEARRSVKLEPIAQS